MVGCAEVALGESSTVETRNDLIERGPEIVRGGQHVTHVQQRVRLLLSVGLAQNTAKDLFNIDLAGLVRQGRQNVGEGAVPTFFQRVHRDDEPDRALFAEQIHALELVYVGGLDRDLLGRNTSLDELVTQPLKRGSVLARLRLSLKQHDWANISATTFILLCSSDF